PRRQRHGQSPNQKANQSQNVRCDARSLCHLVSLLKEDFGAATHAPAPRPGDYVRTAAIFEA
ncbi:MAG TPA: hypothetical protein VL966_15860, partial [Alphaproteobacteria bacterium]|nr:hypothetical protein [Alphaproteobacteria bacterium]